MGKENELPEWMQITKKHKIDVWRTPGGIIILKNKESNQNDK